MKLAHPNPIGVAPYVIASEARQSSAVVGLSGLLRDARNDGWGRRRSGLPRRFAPRNDESGNVGKGMTL